MKNIPDSAEDRLKLTVFLVEANSFATNTLWQDYSPNSIYPIKFKGVSSWEQISDGRIVQIGELDGRPVNISIFWARINNQLVGFWEAVSQVVDYSQIDNWMEKNFHAKWDNNTRWAVCDAMNFHHCIEAVNELNKNK